VVGYAAGLILEDSRAVPWVGIPDASTTVDYGHVNFSAPTNKSGAWMNRSQTGGPIRCVLYRKRLGTGLESFGKGTFCLESKRLTGRQVFISERVVIGWKCCSLLECVRV
jgi:hypothetical protein